MEVKIDCERCDFIKVSVVNLLACGFQLALQHVVLLAHGLGFDEQGGGVFFFRV